MKVLFIDRARTATISSISDSLSYPASNLADVFLDRPYVATTTTDTITFDLGAGVDLNCLFLGYCYAGFVAVGMTNALGAPVYSATVNVRRPIETLYFTAVKARYVTLTIDLANGISAWVLGYRYSLIAASLSANLSSFAAKSQSNSFDGIPDITYPDNVAGISYQSNFASGLGGWAEGHSAGSAGTVSNPSNVLDFVVGSAGGGSSYVEKTSGLSIPTATAKVVILRVKRVSGSDTLLSLRTTGGSVIGNGSYTATTGAWQYVAISALDPTYWTGTITGLRILFRNAVSGGNWQIDTNGIYIGDGSYTWTVADDSGHSNVVTPKNGLSRVAGSPGWAIQTDGITGTLAFSTPTMGDVYGIDLRFKIPTLPTTDKVIASIGAGTSVNGFTMIVNSAAGAGYVAFMRAGGSENLTLPSGTFEAGVFHTYRVEASCTAKIVSVYKDGSLIAYATLTNTPLPPGLASQSLLGTDIGLVNPISVAFDYVSIDGTGYVYNGRAITWNPTTKDLAFTNSPTIASVVKMKGVGIGMADQYVNPVYSMSKSRDTTTTVARSPGGQTMRNVGPVFRGYEVTIPALSRADFRAIDEKLGALGTGYPIYVDINEDPVDGEDPLYAVISDNWTPANRNQFQDITIPFLEAK